MGACADASIYERMGKVYDGVWGGAVLEQIAAAMQRWRGAGRWDGLTIDGLRAHKTAWKAGQLNGTSECDGALEGSPPTTLEDHWKIFSIVRVARLLKQQIPLMNKLHFR